MSGETLIKVQNVSKKYCRSLKRSLWYGVRDILGEILGRRVARAELRRGEFWALRDVSFEVKRGECVALIGLNGAGKSTLLKMMNGLIKPSFGEIRMRGQIGALIELGAGFNPVLTGRENVYVNAAVLGISKKDVDRHYDEIVAFAGIPDFMDSPVKSYSSGMQVRLGFAIAATLRPDILLIDEVLAVGDTAFRMKCYDHVLSMKKDKTSIILVSHNMLDIVRVADRVVVLHKGQKTFDGPLEEGICRYQELSAPEVLRHDHERVQKATFIRDVRFLGGRGELENEFCTGDELQADITICSEQTVENARLIIHIEAPVAGILSSFSTPYKNFGFDLKPGKTIIRMIVPHIPLLVGTYNITVDIYGPNITDFLDRMLFAGRFRIVGPPVNTFGYGICYLFDINHEWRLIEE